MNILVTGGAGFIGSNLIDRLLADKHKVVCLDDLSTGSLGNIEHNLNNKNFKFIRGSILNRSQVKDLTRDADLIYHLAAVVGVSNVIVNMTQGTDVNIYASCFLVNCAYQAKKKLVFASSSEVYGRNNKKKFKETDECLFGPVYEKRWWYGAGKFVVEHLILGYSEKGFRGVSVRLFNTYGPRSRNSVYASVVPKFIGQALVNEPITVYGDGQQVRCFNYVGNTVDGLIKIAQGNLSGEVFNLGNPEPLTILSLAKRIKKLSGSSSEIKFVKNQVSRHEPILRTPDIDKIKRACGFTPKVGLDEGLKKTIEWFKMS